MFMKRNELEVRKRKNEKETKFTKFKIVKSHRTDFLFLYRTHTTDRKVNAVMQDNITVIAMRKENESPRIMFTTVCIW
jgi:hypothetical protein